MSAAHENRLIHATSPYLLQHAHNPVDWYEWGPEALERSDEWSTCGLVDADVKTFPPQPLRFVGGHVVRRAIQQTERRQDEGRRPGRIASRLIRLAPAGLVPVRR